MVEQVDGAINRYGAASLTEIELTRDEYLAFLEGLDPRSRILMGLPDRMYRCVHIAVTP